MVNSFSDFAADRRAVMSASGAAALLALAGQSRSASAASEITDLEAANDELVTNFCRDWGTQEVAKLLPYISETLEYHVWEGGPVINGAEQFEKQMGGFMSSMKEIDWEISRSFAIGDIVINERIDHFIRPEGSEQPDDHFHITGVFLVRDGKIQYWKDYNMPTDA